MKNSLRIMLVLALGLMANAFTAYAQGAGNQNLAPDRVGRWELGIGAAGAFNDKADDSVFVSAAVDYGVTPYIALGVEGGWQEADGDVTTETVGYVPVLFDIIVRVPTVHEAIVPYGVLGLGGMGVYVERDDNDDVDDTAFAWKLGGGVDWFLNNNWILNFEFAYWSADVSLPRSSLGNDVDFWTVGVAIKYLF